MLKHSHYIALGAVVLLTVVLLNLPGRVTVRMKLAISGLFLPLFGVAGSGDQLARKTADTTLSRTELSRQLERLQQENSELRQRVAQLEEAGRENIRLHDLLNLVRPSAWRRKIARVVSRDPANWWRTIRIDAGARDGVVTNAVVFNTEGLVGRVAEVGFAQSLVVLVGDPNCRVAVMIEESREKGIIAPATSPFDSSVVDLGYLSRASLPKAGQRVVTTISDCSKPAADSSCVIISLSGNA